MAHEIKALPDKGKYAAFLRALRAAHADAPARDPFDRFHRRTTAGALRIEARCALDRRINLRGGLFEACVPMDIDLQRDARDLADILERRIRVYQFRTSKMRARFGHLLARHDD